QGRGIGRPVVAAPTTPGCVRMTERSLHVTYRNGEPFLRMSARVASDEREECEDSALCDGLLVVDY
ncbi:MAG: hypothetical protein ACREMY_26940, partial [bacterium]